MYGWSVGMNEWYMEVFLVIKFRDKRFRVYVCIKQTPWSESASELYRPSDRRLLAK
jgi:hypothetical protein